MTTYNEQLQRVWHEYVREHTGIPAAPIDVVKWGLERGLLGVRPIDPVAMLAKDMSRALREEYGTDDEGRRYRKNHSITVTHRGVQLHLWGEMRHVARPFMAKAFQQRRRGVVDDCVQLKNDMDAYNAMHPGQRPIQLPLDFTDDVAEAQAAARARVA